LLIFYLFVKSAYCYKDDCKQLDNIPSETEKFVISKIRKMFRETMASIRGLLPEPLCFFEDTGLIILVFVIISTLLHFTNMLFSKSVGKYLKILYIFYKFKI
jgi:hypothetical protein